ncbi:hypothetical protein ACLKA6_008207 [Drosophila palustris]
MQLVRMANGNRVAHNSPSPPSSHQRQHCRRQQQQQQHQQQQHQQQQQQQQQQRKDVDVDSSVANVAAGGQCEHVIDADVDEDGSRGSGRGRRVVVAINGTHKRNVEELSATNYCLFGLVELIGGAQGL